MQYVRFFFFAGITETDSDHGPAEIKASVEVSGAHMKDGAVKLPDTAEVNVVRSKYPWFSVSKGHRFKVSEDVFEVTRITASDTHLRIVGRLS